MTLRRMSGALGSQVDRYLALNTNPKPLHLIYSSSPRWPRHAKSPSAEKHSPIHVGVLDSSFNPPQAAHFALATGKKPAAFAAQNDRDEYDAILLLFSVKNADKGTGTSKDASTVQRLHMMELMAIDLEQRVGASVAVGMIEEPLMYRKSTLIHDFVRKEDEEADVRLHWLVGFDTLERFFQVKYYPSPRFFADACQTFFRKERTTFVCARRGKESLPNKPIDEDSTRSDAEVESAFLNSELVKPWLDEGGIVMVDLKEDVQGVSSTAVRRLISQQDLSTDDLTIKLRSMTSPSVAQYLADPHTRIYAKAEGQ